jgi:tryptophan-rich sensory protein
MSKGKNGNDIMSYILLTAPIIIGLGSGYFVSRKRIPRVKSYLNPPAWLFGVVWPTLYLLLGYASYLIWNTTTISMNNKQFYLFLYTLQVILVMSWWPYFVNYPNKLFSTVTLIMLTVFAIVVTILFYNVKAVAGYFLIPYVIWLSFASFLTSQTQV